MYFTYILYSKSYNRYYVGHCQDAAARLQRHNAKQIPSTKNYTPWELVYMEAFVTRSKASERERYFKKQKSKKYIEQLINSEASKHAQ